MKTYIVESDVQSWLHEHRDELFDDILEACENGLIDNEDKIIIATFRTMYGITVFNLPSPEEVVASLRKCENSYVSREEYEKAARARDCGSSWEERNMIYKENRNSHELRKDL